MGSKAKASDYQLSQADRENTALAVRTQEDFRTKYAPLLKDLGDRSQNGAVTTVTRGRGNADTMQALTGSGPSLKAAEGADGASPIASGLVGQLGEANSKAKSYENTTGANVIATARNQQATAQDGLATVARLGTSSKIVAAQANQQVAEAKQQATAQVVAALATTGANNFAETGNIFKPGVVDTAKTEAIGLNPKTGGPWYRPAANWAERLAAGRSRTLGL